MTDRAAVLAALQSGPLTSGKWALITGGSTKLTTRISELRADGWNIPDEWLALPSGKRVKQYRLGVPARLQVAA